MIKVKENEKVQKVFRVQYYRVDLCYLSREFRSESAYKSEETEWE